MPLQLLPSSDASPFASYCAGCPIILPRENEPVLLGAAVLGAVAGKKFPGVRDAMKALNAAGKVFPVFPQLRSIVATKHA
jgi:ribulose kinase